jgi:large subunit ribosomal protein L17
MRHGKKFNHLSRTAPHRSAMLSNMASSLILSKRITTTVAKAKALRKFVEPILTKAKDDTTHSRRMAFRELNDKETVKMLFDEIATKIGDRPGGYTRIIKMGNRLGDNADMCIIELVDYNELLLKDAEAGKAKATTRRSRKGKTAEVKAETTEAKVTKPEAKIEEPQAEVEEVEAKLETTEEEKAPEAEEPKAEGEDKTEDTDK